MHLRHCRRPTVVWALLIFAPVANAKEPVQARIEKNVPVPMRDGCVLRADVSYPAGNGPFPVLVLRTPYGKPAPTAFAGSGLIVVTQDARGRYASDGNYESFVRPQTHDAEDGFDTVEWAAKLPGSTGKVGTFGVSYNAFLQWRLAALRPPSLVAMAAFSIPARYTDLESPGTIRPGRRLKWWQGTMSPDMRKRDGGPAPHTNSAAKELWDSGQGDQLLMTLPWSRLPSEIFGHEADAVRAWLRDPSQDPWRLDVACRDVDVPNLNVCGWFDHCNGSIDLHTSIASSGRSEAARRRSRLIIGPWSHVGLGKRRQGKLDFGPEAQVDLDALQVRWFDHWLKGAENGCPSDPPVRIFVMGINRWRDEAQWPPERAKSRTMYLASGGKANTPRGDGRLTDAKNQGAAPDHFTYDPQNPVKTLWDEAMFTAAADQRPLAKRDDILVYQSEPLATAVEVTGYPKLELFAASSAPDTDFFARLIDVAPDGLARDVCQGMVRARYRHGLDKPALLTSGETTRFEIQLGATSNVFLPGHRIRVDVTSSDFPNYDRNHNTAADQNSDGELRVAEQTIFHDSEQASRLILPVIAAE